MVRIPRAAGWKDREDYPVFVPIGDYHEEHHSICYRAFNLHREAEAHKYPAAPRGQKPDLLPDSAWKGPQESLRGEIPAIQK